jgi:hypothetical protein
MKRACVILGVAGLGVPAWGQFSTLTVALTFDRTSIGIGETATATIMASWTGYPVGSYFSSINVDVIASGLYVQVSDVAPVAWNNWALGFDGQGAASGADVLGLEASQFSLIPPFTTEHPILITTFRVTGVAEGFLAYHTVNAPGAPFPFSVTSAYFNDYPIQWTNDSFESGTLVVTPGPGVGAVVVVAGACGIGRRRR